MKPNLFFTPLLTGLLAMFWNPLAGFGQDAVSATAGAGNRNGGLQIDGAGTEGAEFLLLPTGARTTGMGGAVTAIRGSGESVLWSPAGLASLSSRRFLVNHNESAFETSSDVLSVLWPTESVGTFAVTYYLVDFGDLAATDAQGTVQGNIGYRNQEFLLTYANKLLGSLEAGVSYKLIQTVFNCDGRCPGVSSFTRTTHAVDLGLIYNNLAGLPIALGGAIRHLGLPMEGAIEEDPLPTRVRLGVAYDAMSTFTADSTFALTLAVDVEDQTRSLGDPDVMLGTEFSVARSFFLRAGYAFLATQNGGPALGLGVIHEWFYVDLSRGFTTLSQTTGEDSLQISFGLIF